MTRSRDSDTVFGMDEHLVGAGAYLLGAISGAVVLFGAEDNRFARFHGAQSILFSLAVIALGFTFGIVALVLGVIIGVISQIAIIGVLGGFLAFVLEVLALIFRLGLFVAWIGLMFVAYRGDRYELPILGSYARKIARGNPSLSQMTDGGGGSDRIEQGDSRQGDADEPTR